MYYEKSNDAIINWLDENGYLLRKEKINHSYPHCWRCKNQLYLEQQINGLHL